MHFWWRGELFVLFDSLMNIQREIKERQWIDVPQWKIPLLAKKEKER